MQHSSEELTGSILHRKNIKRDGQRGAKPGEINARNSYAFWRSPLPTEAENGWLE